MGAAHAERKVNLVLAQQWHEGTPRCCLRGSFGGKRLRGTALFVARKPEREGLLRKDSGRLVLWRRQRKRERVTRAVSASL